MDYIQRMRDLREDHDKTQQEIADVLGTSQTMYARYERGANGAARFRRSARPCPVPGRRP